MKRRQLWHFFWVLPLTLILILAAVLLTNQLTDNIHVVVPGKLYRSAQLEKKPLAKLVEKYKIKTIVNLRGVHEADSWYRAERAIVKAQNLKHYTLDLPAHGLITHQQLQQLSTLIQLAPKPMLVHCRQGADRTGLASAMGVILLCEVSTPEAAKHQVTWVYNVLSPHSIGFEILQNYFAWLKATNQLYGKQSFLRWASSTSPLQQYAGFYW